MFKKKDPFTFTKFCTLLNGTAAIGSVSLEYQVTSYDDVQAVDFTSVSKSKNRKFLLHCTQRINIYNPAGTDLTPTKFERSYENYPVLINTLMSIKPPASGLDFQLLEYSPQTVNTKVESAGTQGTSGGTTTGSSRSNTVGSSTSQTNSYGANVSIGDVMGVSGSYENSSTSTHDQSTTTGTDASDSSGNDSSNSASMSIKDWGAYSFVDPNKKSPSWAFGQEYPWDVFVCMNTDGTTYTQADPPNPNAPNQVTLQLPSDMSVRLFDGVFLYPPSQLSIFGINFVMKALWLVTIDNGAADEVTVEHNIEYYSASHYLDFDTVLVYTYRDLLPSTLQVDSPDSLSTTINVALMALNPLGSQSNSAIIGFIPNKFTLPPVPASGQAAPTPFNIVSATNDLMISDTTAYASAPGEGAGFTASQTSLQANFTAGCLEMDMTLFFKVTDSVDDYTLFIKHWITGASGVVLTVVINGDATNPIRKYVDAVEAEGGENNLLSIALRSLEYASVDYHDYLQLGLNSIQIKIQPIGGTFVAGSGYQIRAISIERD